MDNESRPQPMVVLTCIDLPRGAMVLNRDPSTRELDLAAWFEKQVGGPLEGQWVAAEEAGVADLVRVLDTDESLSLLQARLLEQGRLHQGVHIGRVSRLVTSGVAGE